MAEKINIAKFELENLDKLVENTVQIKQTMDDLKKANQELKKSGDVASKAFIQNTADIKSLNKSYNANIKVLAEANQKTADLATREKLLTAALNQEIRSIDDARASNKLLNKLRNSANATTEEGRKEIELLNAQLDKNNAFIKQNSDAYAKQKQNIGAYTSAIEKAKIGSKAFGAALKALGIGFILAGIAKLTQAFNRNQKVANTLATIGNAVAIAFDKVVAVVVNTTEAVFESTGGFDALGKVIGALLKLGLTPTRATFTAIKGVIIGAQLAWEKSFFGGNDQKKIEQLNKDLEENKNKMIEIGREAINSGKVIVENFGEAFDEAAQLGDALVTNISKVSFDGVLTDARALTEYRNNIESLIATQEGLIQQYEREAEQLRQRRDDETLSIAERRAANEELGTLLNEQAQQEIKLINLRISGAQKELSLNKDDVNLKAEIIRLNNEILDVENRIEGQRSEQLTNRNALNKEELDQIRAFEDKKKELRDSIDEANIASDQEKEELRLEREFERQELELERLILNESQKSELLALLEEQKGQQLNEIRAKFREENLKGEKKNEQLRVAARKQTLDSFIQLAGSESKIGQAALALKQVLALKEFAIENGLFAAKASLKAAEATTDAAAGQVKTASSAPFPANIPLIAGFIAQVAPIVGVIRNLFRKKPSVPKFGLGGSVEGPLHSQGGTLIEAEGGEFVSSRKAVKKYGPLLSAMNASVGGRPGINMSGYFRDGGIVGSSIVNSGNTGASLEDVRDLIGEIKVVNVASETFDVVRDEAVIVQNASV